MTNTIDITKLTPEQIQELQSQLKQKQAKDAANREKERKAYETDRNAFVSRMYTKAEQINRLMEEFKQELAEGMMQHAVKLSEYGMIRSTSMGGFSLTNEENSLRVKRVRDTEPTWDERAGKGIELIKDFLADTVKKRDADLFEILMSFLERNQAGDLELSRVMDLMQHEAKFNDERWIEGLSLLKESYSNVLKGFGYLFQYKGSDGKWKSLVLNFSSL